MRLHELIDHLEQFDRDAQVFLEVKDMPSDFQGPYVLLSTIRDATVDNWSQYRVSYRVDPTYTFVFVCWARDEAHAVDQCRKAYPECEVVDCVQLED